MYCDKSFVFNHPTLVRHIQFAHTIQKTELDVFFLLENPVFRVMMTKALELAKVKSKCICVDSPNDVGQQLR